MRRLFLYICIVGLISTSIIGGFLLKLYRELPDVELLRDVQLQVPLRIFSRDHKLIAEYGEKRRIPASIEEIPQPLINAVLATEDRRFYQHQGVDLKGLIRAAVILVSEGKKSQGGSTITMQVARNFFLTRKKTYSRKLNEILLAIKIEDELSKEEVLALYLNKVFFGYRAYGVAAAAEVYYGKPLSDLTLAQYAMIAGLPKAPSSINPLANPERALKRRQHVLEKMLEMNYISDKEFEEANNAPVTASYHGTTLELRAHYVAEMVRQELYKYIGEEAYSYGFQVYTTVDSSLQHLANESLRRGLLAYDQRHGLRPLKSAGTDETKWSEILEKQKSYGDLIPGIVTKVDNKSIVVRLQNNLDVEITWNNLKWARRQLGDLRISYPPKSAHEFSKVGDIVYVDHANSGYRLAQIPEVEGALVALSPKDGSILALTGGFDFYRSKFNRASQAELQPGSNFKPFVYSAALNQGFTAASMINDAPVVLNDPSEESLWRPQNDNNTFNGPTSLRMGLIRSRNLVSIRLLNYIGINYALSYLEKFGFKQNQLPRALSLALGTATVSPLEVARGYAILANGGQKITPYFISKIEDSSGNIIFETQPQIACKEDCEDKNVAPQSIDPRNAYIMTNMLQDAIKRGTGRGAKVIGRHDIAGKTGTTNDQFDAWFSGYNTEIATTVWVGFDNPRSLGEYAAKAALPIWTDFMQHALKGSPEAILPEPPGLVTMRIDPKTGLLAKGGQSDAIFEIFRKEDAPTEYSAGQTTYQRVKAEQAPENIF